MRSRDCPLTVRKCENTRTESHGAHQRHAKRARGTVSRGGAVVRTRWWWWQGRVVAKHEEGRGVWVKILKPSHHGSVLGAPCEVAAGGQCIGAGWLCIRGDGGGGVVRSRNARRGVDLGQNSETKLLWLSFRRAV